MRLGRPFFPTPWCWEPGMGPDVTRPPPCFPRHSWHTIKHDWVSEDRSVHVNMKQGPRVWLPRGRRQRILPTVKDKWGECVGQTGEAAAGTRQLRSLMCLEVTLRKSWILLSHEPYTGSAASVPTGQAVSGAATKNSFAPWAASA